MKIKFSISLVLIVTFHLAKAQGDQKEIKNDDPNTGVSTTFQDYATNTVTAATGSATGIFLLSVLIPNS